MSLLLLIRHALTDATGTRLTGWTPGVHLSPEGRSQAEDLVRRLEPVPIARIYSSPLERCRETAASLAAARSQKVLVRKDLGEVHYGNWQGRPFSQLTRTKLWKTVRANPAAVRFPGGESLAETQFRGTRAIERILRDHPGETVAVFSHGDMIRLLLAQFAGVHLDLYHRLVVAPASVSAVWAGDGMPHIVRLNDTGTLADLASGGERP